MIIKRFLFIFVFLLNFTVQGTTLTGYAPSNIGDKAILFTYADYFTMTKVVLAESEVSSLDSSFTFNYKIANTVKAIIQIGNTESEVYLSPDNNYKLLYSKDEEKAVSFAIQKANIFFFELDTADINYKILQYHNWFDEYIYYHQYDIMRKGIAPYIDTFKIYAYEAYANESNNYFVNYVRFNIAALEKAKVKSSSKKSKYTYYKELIQPFPVYAYNDQYMQYIKSFYSSDFNSLNIKLRSDIILAIDHSSPSRLMTALHRDPFFANDEIRELMMVNMLGNAYYSRQFNRKNIATILDSVNRFAKFEHSSLVAKNMIDYLTKIEAGYPSPEINEINQFGDVVNWGTYDGKFIYVNFFSTWNQDAINEMKLMEELYTKYSDYVEFVSFCTDKDSSTYNAYLKQTPTVIWPMVYIGDEHHILEDFNVKTFPFYVLIDQEGFISQAPSKSPSPDGVYETIENTFKYIKKEIDNQ